MAVSTVNRNSKKENPCLVVLSLFQYWMTKVYVGMVYQKNRCVPFNQIL